jgi:tRNA nucleotidyltransferase/poly(A) polymerase
MTKFDDIWVKLHKLVEMISEPNCPDFYFHGGSLRDIYMGVTPRDYDITTVSISDLTWLISRLQGMGFRVVAETDFGLKMNFLSTWMDVGVECESLVDKISEFDFTCNSIAMDNNFKLYYHESTFKDIDNRRLKQLYNPSPVLMDLRKVKFAQKNFKFLNKQDEKKLYKFKLKTKQLKPSVPFYMDARTYDEKSN